MFLPFETFPADPNRGFDVLPSLASFTLACPSSSSLLQGLDETHILYSNSLLIMPPVPDMSMPFNVISLCGTCFAILIGTTINLIIKKSSQNINDALKGIKTKSPMQRLKEKIQSKILFLKKGNFAMKGKKNKEKEQ